MATGTPRPRRRSRLLGGLGLVALGLGAAGGWLLATESGLRAALALAQNATAGQLAVGGAGGRLIGPLTVERLHWRGPGQTVELQGLHLDWRAGALLQGRLEIGRLHARALRVTVEPGPETPPPQTLHLPLALHVGELGVDALFLGETGAPLLTQLRAGLESDGRRHRLTALRLERQGLRLEAEAELGGDAPLPLKGEVRVRGEFEGHPVELDLQADGPLARLPATGRLASRNSRGELSATLTPFARQPFTRLQAHIAGLDPAHWHPQAPRAELDLDIDIHPLADEEASLAGRLSLDNRSSGPVDRQALPLDALAARLRWQGERLQLADIDARLRGGGRFTGEVDLDLGTPGGFQVRGEVARLDPARLLGTLPPARINARFETAGTLAEPLAVSARFTLNDSRISDRAFRGAGRLQASAERVHDVDLQLAAGDNRLRAQGALGRAGDKLQLDIDAPRLADLGLGGDLQARLTLAGALRTPGVSGTAQSRSLTLPGRLRLAGLRLDARMGLAPSDPMQLRLELAALELPQQERRLGATKLDLSGSRARHRLELQTRLELPDLPLLRNAPLALAASGGEQDGPAWSGTLERLELGGAVPLLRLTAPAALRLGEALRFGPARFEGHFEGRSAGQKTWQARIDSLERRDGRWQSAGAIEALPVAPFAAALEKSSLRLDAQWDLSLGNKPRGSLSLTRREGDLQFGAAGPALGLSEARLDLGLADRPRLQLRARGERLGQVQGEIALHPEAPLEEAWSGTIRASMADLSWIGPLLGPTLQLGGHLEADARLGGTPRQPRVDGRLTGETLHLRELDSGLRLESGQLQLVFSESELQLEKLQFSSPHAPLPQALDRQQRAAFAPIVASPGRVEGKGRLQFAGAEAGGQLEFRLERLGVMQKPRQWVALSGQGRLGLAGDRLDIGARLDVDGGYWQLADSGAPSLSDDVVVRRQGAPAAAPRTSRTRLDVNVDLGRHFHFSGAGVDSRLRGALRLQGEGTTGLRASGSIRTADGRFDAYGQKLEIEQGILTFNGLVNNPGLNVRAMRRNQAVAAGVSITGTAQRPVITLVSDPAVPDAEKLSWLIFGEAPEQGGGVDHGTLLAAANAILGGQSGGSGNVLRDLQQTLGVNVSMGRSSQGSGPRSQVASSGGFGPGGSTASEQVLRVGTQLARGLSLSYEYSLTGAESVVKLTLALSRRLSLVGQAGTDNAVDLFYNFRFGGTRAPRGKDTKPASGTP